MKRILDLRLKVEDILVSIFNTGICILIYYGLIWLFDSKILAVILIGLLRVLLREYVTTRPEKPKRNKVKTCDKHKEDSKRD